jgi:L-ascorbate metabolism protein UlaG (beta-lactamase superfamily)
MKVFILFVALFVLTLSAVNQASAQETKVRWFGHAAFSITTPRGKVLLIDPWLSNPSNPEAKDGHDPLASVPKVDYILITHGHRDHVGDAVEIAKKTGAALVCNPELAGNLVKLAGFPEKQADTDAIMGIGGEIRIKDGPGIYHSGDTAYFKDMETIGEQYPVDLALLNIGGHFGMEPRMAARAAQSVRARLAVPQHYATFPGIAQNADEFAAELKRLKIPFYEMKPGETVTFRGRQMTRK